MPILFLSTPCTDGAWGTYKPCEHCNDDLPESECEAKREANTRSVGNLLAPHAEAELVEKLATDRERAATVKYLYKRADDIADPFWRSMVQNWVLVIEKGEHAK